MRRAGDHIGDEVAMARRVEDAEVSVWCREVLRGDLDGHATLLLLLRLVHEVSESKASLSIELCFALIGIELVIRECAVLEQDLAAQRALAAIDMADNDQVQVVLLFFRCLDHLVVELVLNLGVGCIQLFFVNKGDLDLWLSGARADYFLQLLLVAVRLSRLGLLFVDLGLLLLLDLLLDQHLLVHLVLLLHLLCIMESVKFGKAGLLRVTYIV